MGFKLNNSASFYPSYKENARQMQMVMANVDACKSTLNKIRSKAEDVRAQEKLLRTLMTETENCWKGKSGDAMQERLQKLIKEQEQIALQLEEDARCMLEMIQRLEQQDKKLADYIHGYNEFIQGINNIVIL